MANTKTLVLPPALGSYVTLFQARRPPGGALDADRYYSIVLMWPKSEAKEALAELRKAALEVAEAQWPGKGADVLRRMRYPLFADGDERYPENPSFKGMMFVHAKRKEAFGPPGVVDRRVQDIFDQDEAYSGCTFRAQVTLFPFDHPTGGKGVGVGLSNVMVVHKGKRLDGRQEASEAFADYTNEAPDADEEPADEAPSKTKRQPWE